MSDTNLTPDSGALGLLSDTPHTEVKVIPSTGALSAAGRHGAAQATASGLPVVANRPSEINVDQTTQLISTQFEVAINDSAPFRNRDILDTVSINTGLLDDDLVAHLVPAITGAFIDETELHVQPERMVSVIRGRDAATLAVDSTVYVTYAVAPVLGPDGSVNPPAAPQPGFSQLPQIMGVTTPLVLRGSWSARTIAADLLKRIGLGLTWQTYDYYLREDFPVNGSVSQAIQTLVEPFSHFESSKVDIWLEGNSLVVRTRGAGGAGLTLDVHDARITDLMIRARFLGYIRVVRLTGASLPTPGGITGCPGKKTTTTVDEFIDPTDGITLISRVVTTTEIRILDNAVLSETIETYMNNSDPTSPFSGGGIQLVALQESTSTWDELVLGPNCTILNNPAPVERKKVTVTSSRNEETTAMEPTSRTTIINTYNSGGFLQATETLQENFADSGVFGKWEVGSREVKSYRVNGVGMYEVTTVSYGSDGTPGEIHRTTANGSPPGGPGRSLPKTMGGENLTPVTLGKIVSQLPGAKDFTLLNPNLLDQHLRIILAQAAAEHALTEVEVSFTAAGIPWLHRGQYLSLTGLDDENGDPITIKTALISESRVEYRESSEAPRYTTFVKALYWEA